MTADRGSRCFEVGARSPRTEHDRSRQKTTKGERKSGKNRTEEKHKGVEKNKKNQKRKMKKNKSEPVDGGRERKFTRICRFLRSDRTDTVLEEEAVLDGNRSTLRRFRVVLTEKTN